MAKSSKKTWKMTTNEALEELLGKKAAKRLRKIAKQLTAAGVPLLFGSVLVGYYYIQFSRMIDARMHGEFQRTDPRIFARPLTIRRGQRIPIRLRSADDTEKSEGFGRRPPPGR